MRRDPFDLIGATGRELFWRALFLLIIAIVLFMDVFVWRPD